jgi:hypothetical protein
MKKKREWGSTLKSILGFVIMMAVGAAVGFISVLIAPNRGGDSDTGVLGLILNIAFTIAVLYVGFLVNIILHEFGHYIGGRLSGYGFMSFRVFNQLWTRENGKLVRKKYNIVGTGGQCLMAPPGAGEKSADGKYPYILYNLSGSLMNILLVCLFAALGFLLPAGIHSPVLILIAIFSLILGLANIIPMRLGGVANDGYNIRALGKSENARLAFRLTLQSAAYLAAGVRYKDMPVDWSALPDDFNNPITFSASLLKFNYLHDMQQFGEAKTFAEHILANTKNILEVYKNELNCELLFFEIIGDKNPEKIEALFTRGLHDYIKASVTHVSKHRLTYAYEKLVTQNEKEAAAALERFNRACITFPYAGEVASEREIIAFIDNLAAAQITQPLPVEA